MTSPRFLPRRRWNVIILSLFVLLGLYATGAAQEGTGRVIGTVTDEKGAVVSGATITVTNVDTKASRTTTTGSDGNFEVLLLRIGSYQVTAEQSGFKKAVSETEKLQINQALRFDIKMEVGAPTESVTVTSQASGVETVSPTLGQTVQTRQIVNLPLNGRNVLNLALLQPGVSENNPGDGSAGFFNIAGNRSDSVTFLLDGGVNNNLLNNGVVYNPNPDTIAEFRLLTSNYTAEYGRNGGGIISVVTKSGTNRVHGSAFEFLRNNALNANRFFNNKNGLPKEILKRNQFGFTVGGPITIPKVVEGKDRFFFFVGYQGQRQVQQQTTASVTTFTPAELRGDFSHSGPGGGPNPDVAAFLLANPIYQPNPALAAQAIIGRIDAVAQKYIAAGLIPTSATGQVISQGGATDNRDELTLRFDANLNPKNLLVVTLGTSKNPNIVPFGNAAATTSNVSGFPVSGDQQRRFANISFTRIFSPSLINEFRFTAQRSLTNQAIPAKSLPKAADLGIAITPDNPTGPPRLGFLSGMNVGFSPQGPTTLINNTFSSTDTLSLTKGNHGLKFGGGYTPYQNNTVFDFFVNGEFFFDGPFGIGSNNEFADFILGLPDEYLQFGEAPSDIRSHNVYGFVQDEWRARRNLTLTLGMRYEYSSPKLDTRGRSFSLKFGQQSTVFPNAPKGLLFPGDPGAPTGANFPDKNDWAPRFGFAWDPFKDGRTSVRGGFGVFYDILKGEDNLQFNGQAPFFGFADLFMNPGPPFNAFSAPFANTGQFNPFPSRPPAKNIDFDANGFLPFGGGGVFFVDPNLRTPYTYQYNLSLQRELVRNLTLETSYVGSASHKLTTLVDANPFVLGTTHRIFNTQPGNNDASFSYLLEFRNAGKANYNSLQLSLNKQYSSTGFLGKSYFTLAYTWAHSIDNTSGFRNRNSQVPAYNSDQFIASSDFDIRHRITFSGGWDLPFDHAWSSGPSRLTQGWSLYPIFTWRTGFPLDIFAPLSASRTNAGPSAAGDRQIVRANYIGSGRVPVFSDPRAHPGATGLFYFSPGNFVGCTRIAATGLCSGGIAGGLPGGPEAIANPAVRTYGSLPRNAFRGPGRTNLDLAIGKMTPIFREKLNMEFRAEFFNIFNHAEFANPSTNISSALFGQITTTFDPRIIQFGVKFLF
ncbi:MAG TPA: TonB-dependent receptor [Pyrinomonadaceae bacterium]